MQGSSAFEEDAISPRRAAPSCYYHSNYQIQEQPEGTSPHAPHYAPSRGGARGDASSGAFDGKPFARSAYAARLARRALLVVGGGARRPSPGGTHPGST